ncbi:MAG: DNA alkylation repair protein [Bacteroidales bacterium]|nr:DNA alkylation repair protein [Bacteroidales bacterium]MCF8454444.1 DNA alkylation repair protein [Bacteroidales bacterium]
MKQNSDFILDLIADLKGKSEQGYRDFAMRMIPTQQQVLGVRTPDMRNIIKIGYPQIKGLSFQDFFGLMLALKATGIFECIQISHEFIAKNTPFRKKLSVTQINGLLTGLDNWASVDSFAGYVSGPAWIDHQISTEDIMNWSSQENVWIRRLAIVSCVPLNRGSKSEIWKRDITLTLCKDHLTDREAIIHKGISWALRSLVKDHREAVVEFLDENIDSVKAFVRKEVLHKIHTGRKY